MAKVRKVDSLFVFHCPGCKYDHAYDSRWQFNGSLDKPTFTPSLLCNQDHSSSRCHSYVTDGHIRFLDDCWHELKGKTVELPEYEV